MHKVVPPSPLSNSRMFSCLSVSGQMFPDNTSISLISSQVVRRQTGEPHCPTWVPDPPLTGCVILENYAAALSQLSHL